MTSHRDLPGFDHCVLQWLLWAPPGAGMGSFIGALVGGFLFAQLGAIGVTGFNLWSMIVAIIGAVVVLLIYHAVFGRRRIGP